MRREIQIAWVQVPSAFDIEDLRPCTKFLDAEELQTFERYRFDRKKAEFLTGRLLLKSHLGARLGLAREQVRFVKRSHGKLFLDPVAHADDAHQWSFNLTHSGQVVALAITPQPNGVLELGIDVEETSRDHLNLMPSVYTASEIAYVEAKPTEEEKRLAFYELWTRKEAYVKAKGQGLSIPLTSFAVPFGTAKARKSGFEYVTTHLLNTAYTLSVAVQEHSDCEYEYRLEEVDFSRLITGR